MVDPIHQVEAARVRHELLAQWAASGATLAGTHFPGAPLGTVIASGDAWRFEPLADSSG